MRTKLILTFLSLLLLSIQTASVLAYTGAQQAPSESKEALTDEHFAPGQVVSSGKNTAPIGSLKVKTYRLERVRLAKPLRR